MKTQRTTYDGIVKKVTKLFPGGVTVIDESAAHAGDTCVRNSKQTGTHFRVEIVSDRFEGMDRVERHRLVMKLLDEEFNSGLHVQLQCRTPGEETGRNATPRKANEPAEERAGSSGVPAWAAAISDWIEENQPLFLDVRTTAEVQAEPVAGALHIELGQLLHRLETLLNAAGQKDRAVGTFCAAGIRSERALQILEGQGFTQVRNVHSAGLLNFLQSQKKNSAETT